MTVERGASTESFKFLRRPLSYPEEGLRQIFCESLSTKEKNALLPKTN